MQESSGLAVIVEPHAFYSAGLADLLNRKLGIRSMPLQNLEQAVQVLSETDGAALLTLDCSIVGALALLVSTVRMLRDRFPAIPILLTSSLIERKMVFDLIGAGACGVVSKSASADDLLVALRTILSGQIFVPALVREQPRAHSLMFPRSNESSATLTPRQSEVVALMCEGKSNKAIARELGISPSTVKVHLHAVFRSLGVHSRVGAASASFERQISTLRMEAN